jgi:phosphoserine phosphatase
VRGELPIIFHAAPSDRTPSAIDSSADLVVQAPALDARRLADLAAHAARAPSCPSARLAARLSPGRALAGRAVLRGRARAGFDAASVPRDRRLATCRVVAMDMDSTLITIECIDEIADFKGIKPEVAAITASAMRGEIDFAQSLTQRVALLAGLPVRDLAQRLRRAPAHLAGRERMLAAFKAAARHALVSGGFTFFTDRLKDAARLDFTLANTFEVEDDRLTGRIDGDIVDAQAKARAIRELVPSIPGLIRRRSATARTTCRCSPKRTCRSPTAPSRSCARRRRTRSTSAASTRCQSVVTPRRNRALQTAAAALQASSIQAAWIASRTFSPPRL